MHTERTAGPLAPLRGAPPRFRRVLARLAWFWDDVVLWWEREFQPESPPGWVHKRDLRGWMLREYAERFWNLAPRAAETPREFLERVQRVTRRAA